MGITPLPCNIKKEIIYELARRNTLIVKFNIIRIKPHLHRK